MLRRGLGIVILTTAALLMTLLPAAAGADIGAVAGARDSQPSTAPTAGNAAVTGVLELLPQGRKRRKGNRFECRGVARHRVAGTKPTYTRKKLARFRNHRRVCRALWLPRPRARLVPQGIAVAGRAAWVSGFRYGPVGERPCRLLKVRLRDGRLLAWRTIVGRVGTRPLTYCRHGGGIARTGSTLWLVERNKLWRINPAESRGRVIRADRVWRLRAPVRGSAIVVRDGRLGIVPWRRAGTPHIYWYRVGALMRPDARELVARKPRHRKRPKLVAAASRSAVPTLVQGATVAPNGRVYLTRSTLGCGELVTPGGKRIGFVPGAEGVVFSPTGRRLWAISESGSRPYSKSRKPFTAAMLKFEWPGVARGRKTGCGFE